MTYYDLTIEKYLQIKEILETETNDDLQIQVDILSVLNECTQDELLDLPLPEYKKKVAELDYLSTPIQPKPQCPKSIMIDKEVYEAVRDVNKFTAGQYIDYNSLLKSEDFYSIIPNLLACFFIPKGKDYGKGYDIMEVADKIRKNVSIGLALDVCFFFQQQSVRSINRTLDYLVWTMKVKSWTGKKETRKMMKTAVKKLEALRDLFQNGVGGIM